MNILKDNLKKLYPKYLFAALGSGIISSIYTLVDTIMIGQYEGPSGSAALAVVLPMYTIIFSIGLLFGVGGAVLMSVARGKGDAREGNRYFTVSLIALGGVIAVIWALLFLFDEPLLRIFGGEGDVLELSRNYFFWIKLGLPVFTFGPFLACFVRNDGNPVLATAATLTGGVWNIIGDYLLIFVFDLGMTGAAIATITGQILSMLVLLSHFLTKRRKLALVRPTGYFRGMGQVMYAGLASFAVDLSAGVLVIFFNNRIMFYLGQDALAVYGVAVNIFMLVQCLAYGVGQASQPIISENFGADQFDRVKQTVRMSILVSFLLSGLGLLFAESIPVLLVRAFMDSTPEVEAIAPEIIRIYCLGFVFMPFNVFSLYFFQSVMRASSAWIVAIVRGIGLSSLFVFLLPVLFGGKAIWWAMPLTELLVFLIDFFLIRYYLKSSKALPNERQY